MTLFEQLSQGETGIQSDTVEAWGQTLRLRSLNGDEMIDYADSGDEPAHKRVDGVRLAVATLEDENGARVAREDQPKLVAELIKKDFRTLQRLTRAARALNGLALGGADAAKANVKND